MNMLNIVLAVWSIIVGGYIIFIDGDKWCIVCGSMIENILGIVAIVLGLVVLVNSLRVPGTVANRV